jgi:hypothetical protein
MDLRLILSGGYGSLKLGELNRSLLGWAEWQKEKAILMENWDYHGEEVRKLSAGYDIRGEIIAFFTPHIAVSIGAGFIYGEHIEEKIELFVDVNSISYALARPAKVNAFPLILSAYYFYPLINEKFDLFLKAGVGLIWAKYIQRAANKRIELEELEAGEIEPGNFTYVDSEFISASARDSIFVGGLGLSYRIDPSLSFFIEGEARMAKINGFQGETHEGETGELYFFEEYSSDIDFWQAKFQMLTEGPSGDNFRSVKKAVVDFSGYSIKIGLLIKF